jgi:hypothetical protein
MVGSLPVMAVAALASLTLAATLVLAGTQENAMQIAGGSAIALAGLASLVAFRSFWADGESRAPGEQAGSFFWLLSGAGLIFLGADVAFGLHQAVAGALDGLHLPMVPGAEEAHVLALAAYALTALLVAWAFRGEVTSGRASASLILVGGAAAAGALLFEAVSGDSAYAFLTASGVVMLAAAAARTFEVRQPRTSRTRSSLPGRRLPARAERLLDAVEPAVAEIARSQMLTLKLIAISTVVVGLAAGAGRVMFGSGEEHQLFRDFGPVTLVSSTFLVLGGVMGLLSWRNSRQATGRPVYGDLWAAWGLGFIVLALMQPLDLHGRAGGLIAMVTGVEHPLGFNATSDAIIAVYGLAGIGITAVLAKQMVERPAAVARFAMAVPAVGLMIAIDGFLGHSAFMWVFEESVELVAASFFVAGFAQAYRQSLPAATAAEPIPFQPRKVLQTAA